MTFREQSYIIEICLLSSYFIDVIDRQEMCYTVSEVPPAMNMFWEVKRPKVSVLVRIFPF